MAAKSQTNVQQLTAQPDIEALGTTFEAQSIVILRLLIWRFKELCVQC